MSIFHMTALAFIFIWLLPNPQAYGDYPDDVIISLPRSEIRVGEPLVVKLTYRFEQPQLVAQKLRDKPAAGPARISKTMPMDALFGVAPVGSEASEPVYHPIMSEGPLRTKDERGLQYEGHFVVFDDLHKDKILFNSPGSYRLQVVVARGLVSNELIIQVAPASDLETKALSILAGRADRGFVQTGKRDKTDKAQAARLERIVKECEGTLLAKFIAARLGLERVAQFQKKYPGEKAFWEFKARKHRGEVSEPLFDDAIRYLRLGKALPDEFPVREAVLVNLVGLEAVEDRWEVAEALLDELGTKYPCGKYGRKAARTKAELLKLKRDVPQQFGNQPDVPSAQHGCSARPSEPGTE